MESPQPLTTAAALRAERPLAPAEAMAVMRDVANALAARHARGAAYGAVCPENIPLDERGVARLRERPAQPSEPLSPEQAEGRPPDPRSDVYALGRTIGQLLESRDAAPEPLRRLLATMTAEDPAARPRNADEVLLGIEACELLAGIRARRPGQRPDCERATDRRLLPFVVIGLALLVLALAFAALLGPPAPPRGSPPESFKPLVDRPAPSAPKAKP